MARTARFDSGAFFAALDAERQARQCTWKQVAEECGISASTLSRMSQGRHPDVNGLAALAAWSGLDMDRFVRSAASQGRARASGRDLVLSPLGPAPQ